MRNQVCPPLRLSVTPLWLALAFVACSESVDVTDPGPDRTPAISVAAASSALALPQGERATVTVTVTRSGGLTGSVNLSLTGTPTGLTTTFAPMSVPAGETSSVLTVSAGGAAPIGTHELIVRASGAGVQQATAALGVTVEEGPTFSISLDPAVVDIFLWDHRNGECLLLGPERLRPVRPDRAGGRPYCPTGR